METRQLNFDVARGGIQHRLFVRVGDVNSRTIVSRFNSCGKQLDVISANIRILRPDQTEILNTCTVEENTVKYTFTGAEDVEPIEGDDGFVADLVIPGEYVCEYILYGANGAVMTSPQFVVTATDIVFSGAGAQSSNAYPALIAALMKLQEGNFTVEAVGGDEADAVVTVGDTTIHIKLTVPNGEQGEQGPQGIQGETGPQGEPGATGVSVESVAIDDGGHLIITLTDGTVYDAGMSKGDKGEQGIQGATGATGPQGAQGPQGPAGNNGADGNDYILTDKDKQKIAEIAEEKIVNDYAVRKTIFITYDGYVYNPKNGELGFLYDVIVGLSANEIAERFDFVYWRYDDDRALTFTYKLNTRVFGSAIFFTAVDESGLVISGKALLDCENCVNFTIYQKVASETQYGVVKVGEGLQADEGVLSVDKTALLGNIEFITPQKYGAKADCVTDDTGAIQAAFDACNKAGGGTVYLPKGTYLLGDAVKFYSNMHIIGDGAVLLQKDGNVGKGGTDYCNLMRNYNTGIGGYGNTENVIIEGITFDGGGQKTSPTSILCFCHSKNITIKNCMFTNGYTDSATSSHDIECNSSKTVIIENCRFIGNRRMKLNAELIQIDSIDSALRYPWLTDNGSAIIEDGTACEDIVIRDCVFEGHHGLNDENVETVGNTFIGNHTDRVSRNIRIENNVFKTGCYFVKFMAADNVVISSNYLENMHKGASINPSYSGTECYMIDNVFVGTPPKSTKSTNIICRGNIIDKTLHGSDLAFTKFNEALDAILEIQNSLIGGDGE